MPRCDRRQSDRSHQRSAQHRRFGAHDRDESTQCAARERDPEPQPQPAARDGHGTQHDCDIAPRSGDEVSQPGLAIMDGGSF
jgi:hypothetical protein